MSLNNLNNKRSLFEMKNQNKYAQLVESPHSPEPPPQGEEKVICPQNGSSSSDSSSSYVSLMGHINKDHSDDNAIVIEDATQPKLGGDSVATTTTILVEQENIALPLNSYENHSSPSKSQKLTLNDVEEIKRNHSYQQEQQQQQHTSAKRKASQCSSQMSTSFVSTVSSSQQSASAGAGAFHKQSASSSAGSSGRGTNLTRTVSQSMLELDQSNKMDRFEVSWKNLSFSYSPSWIGGHLTNKKPTHVLRNISGTFKSNQLIAIIGPSGCGKTTLLQFLAGNNPTHRDQLRIIGLDEPKVAFIGQGDCLLPGLTARETLLYASRLQNSKKDFNHQQHIQPIITELGLTDCADRSVTKLSGGQAKRVTIAQELLYPTNLLILDEVTSGLDASTSYSIVKLLKQLVSDNDYPMSIVMSIHQPSAKLFAVFDQVYVMSEGCCIYEGSCGVNIVNTHLKRFGLECPKFHNIADYLIEIASDDLIALDKTGTIMEEMIQFQRKRCQLKESEQDTGARRSIYEDDIDTDHKSQRIPMLLSSNLYDAVEKARAKRERPISSHLSVHFNRSLLRIRRSYILTYLQLTTYILLGLQLSTFYGPDIGRLSGCPRLPVSFMALVFSNDNDHDNPGLEMRRIQENMNFLLVAIMTATFAALEITVITFPLEAKTVKREWRNGWYRVSSYFMGRTLADLPFQMVFVIIFCIVIYTLTGQIGLITWRFCSFVTIIVMTALIAQTVGFTFGALFMDNLPAAVFTAPLCIFPALLFSGFFSRVSQIPVIYKPLTYISHFRYAFDALLVTLYGYDRCNCDQTTLTSYHESLQNQTSTIKVIFKSLFGSVDCGGMGTTINPEENSIEDATTPLRDTNHLLLNHTATTMIPKLSPSMMKPIEDALIEGVFEHMKNTTSSPESSIDGGLDAMDLLVHKFSSRITTMMNSQSNFGHQVPLRCQEFNSYLMTEFDLHNDDLIFGLAMLFIVVILSRLICNAILTFTIASRTN